jgi:hypothetical protein
MREEPVHVIITSYHPPRKLFIATVQTSQTHYGSLLIEFE